MAQNTYIYRICYLVILIIASTPFYGHAQSKLNTASAEDIAIAFYKTGNVVPNFESWIENTELYMTTPLGRRPEVMKAELLRLKIAYKNFTPQENILNLRTSAYLTPYKSTDEEGIEHFSMTLDFDKETEVFYFPYEFLNQTIMIIPNNLNILKTTTITSHDFERLDQKNTKDKAQPLTIQIQPIEADMKQPHMVDGVAQWAFKVKIVAMESWDERGNLLWQYTSPNYISQHKKELQNLYEDRPTESQNIGDVKILNIN